MQKCPRKTDFFVNTVFIEFKTYKQDTLAIIIYSSTKLTQDIVFYGGS